MGTTPPKGNADYLKLGDWNAVCFECGRKRKASELKKHWQGYYVCPEHWEARHPQDFVRNVKDIETPPWTQPKPADVYIQHCTLAGTNSVAGVGTAGCMMVGRYIPNSF